MENLYAVLEVDGLPTDLEAAINSRAAGGYEFISVNSVERGAGGLTGMIYTVIMRRRHP